MLQVNAKFKFYWKDLMNIFPTYVPDLDKNLTLGLITHQEDGTK